MSKYRTWHARRRIAQGKRLVMSMLVFWDAHEHAPTYCEVGRMNDMLHPAVAREIMVRLQKEGYLAWDGRRGWHVTPNGAEWATRKTYLSNEGLED